MQEQEIIARHFAPLAQAGGGVLLGAGDDAAALHAPAGQLLLSTDTLNAGVHFFADTPPHLLARKAAAVSLSDIAAMGGRALWLTLALTAPASTQEEWFAQFAQGLASSCAQYDYRLVGGDLTCGAQVSITTTAAGVCQRAVTRSGAQVGDAVWVSGALGGAAYAVAAIKNNWVEGMHFPDALRRLQDPTPRLQVAAVIAEEVSAMMDVSDGLFISARTIAEQSGVAVQLDAAALPLHPAVAETSAGQMDFAFGGGDEYELFFTAPADANIPAQVEGVPLTKIGRVTAGAGVTVQAVNGEALKIDGGGYSHTFGA